MNPDLLAEQRAKVEAFQKRHRIGLLTLLFTDIVGSTQLKQDLGDRKAFEFLHRHHELVRETLRCFPDAEEISTSGDSFFIIFTKPSDAVHFSLLFQSHLRKLSAESGAKVLDRIGLHIGEVFIEERSDTGRTKDLFGLQVDICARVMSLSEGNQILLTRSAFDNARQVLKGQHMHGIADLAWLNHGPYLLKGVEDPIEICEVGELAHAVLAPPPDSEKVHRHISPDAEPVLGWRPALDQIVPGTEWRLEEKLGEGAFGEVWLGRNPRLNERRVFKFCFRADRIRSLKREVTLFRLLKERVGEHPHIAKLYDVFFDEPPYYIITDYVAGRDLKTWCASEGGVDKIPLAKRLEIVAQIADGLQAAHNSGIIHRDIKPANILVDKRPEVAAKLADFGIGQVVAQEILHDLTQAGFTQTMMAGGLSSQSGTHLYMAPEVVAGKPATPKSDLYSLGVVLFQFVAGDFNRPLTMDWQETITDPLLREDLRRCFAGEIEQRFQNASELATRLRSLEDRRTAQQRQKNARARALVFAAVAVIGLVLTVIAARPRYLKWKEERAGAQAVRNLGSAYAALNTYQSEAIVRQEQQIAGASQNVEYRTFLTLARPNKVRLSMSTVNQEFQLVCDGKLLWTSYKLGSANQYTEKPAPPNLAGVFQSEVSPDPILWGTSFAMHLYPILMENDPVRALSLRAKNIRAKGYEQVGTNTAIALLWEESEEIPPADWKDSQKSKTNVIVPVKAWIKDGLLVKLSKDIAYLSESLNRFLGADVKIDKFQVFEEHQKIILNGPVRADAFDFEPAAGAKKVDRLNPIAALIRSSTASAAPARAVRSLPEVRKALTPRDPKAGRELIDLETHYNALLEEFYRDGSRFPAPPLPSGLQRFGATEFDLRGIIRLGAEDSRTNEPAYPSQVKGIAIGMPVRKLHFLHGTDTSHRVGLDDALVGKYIIHFSDGQTVEWPLIYGKNIRSFRTTSSRVATEAQVAWSGTTSNWTFRIYQCSWENPRPNVPIASLDFVSSLNPDGLPFLMAITAE